MARGRTIFLIRKWEVVMAGRPRVGREEQAERLGTSGHLDRQIWQLHQRSWPLRKIGRHLGLGHVTVKYRLDAMQGKKRVQYRYAVCSECGESVREELLDEGLCQECIWG